MSGKIEIDELELVEKILIPMQNLSLSLRFINEQKVQVNFDELYRGLLRVQTSADEISRYLTALKEGTIEERTLKLPGVIRSMVAEKTSVPGGAHFENDNFEIEHDGVEKLQSSNTNSSFPTDKRPD